MQNKGKFVKENDPKRSSMRSIMAHIRIKLEKQFNDFYAFSLNKSEQRSLVCYIYETDYNAYDYRKLNEFQKTGKRITSECFSESFKSKLEQILNGWNFTENGVQNYSISYILGDPNIPTFKGNYLKIH